MERTMETMRLRLLRLVAGLLAAVAFVSVGPFSSAVSRWVSGYVLFILSRAETAVQLLVIVQARVIAAGTGRDVKYEQLREHGLRDDVVGEGASSLSNLRERLEALQEVLEDLPRHGLRLLRRTEKRVRRLGRAARTHRTAPCPDASEALLALRFVDGRIERPPDKGNGQLWL